MQKRLIIFDMDGVLYNSANIAFEGLREIFPDLTKEIMNEVLTGNFHEEIKKLTLPKAEVTEEEREARKARYTELKTNAPLFMGIRELLKEIDDRGLLIALNTSAASNNCVPLLEKQQVLEHFDFIGTKEVSTSKTEKFQIMLRELDVSQHESIFVTDTLGDLKEASAVEIPTIAVTYGAHSREYFERDTWTHLVAIVDTVEELREYLLH